jgi:hypothetical protein
VFVNVVAPIDVALPTAVAKANEGPMPIAFDW